MHAQRALDALQRGASELTALTGKASGQVALGTLPTVGAYLLPELLPRFHKLYPDVRLRLVEQTSEGLEDRVAKGELDLAVLTLPVRRVDLVQQKLWSEDFVLAVPRGHPLAEAKKPVALRDVLGEPLMVMPDVAGTRALEAAGEAAGEPLNVVVETDNPEAMRRLVERGLGIALLPSIMARERTGRGFEVVEVGQGGVRRQVALLHRGEGYLDAAARALEDVPRRVAAELLRSGGEEGLVDCCAVAPRHGAGGGDHAGRMAVRADARGGRRGASAGRPDADGASRGPV